MELKPKLINAEPLPKLISISFVILYTLAMLRPIEPVLEYYVNKDYIIDHFCVNQDKPAMHCDGKCYLMKQLQKQNNSEEKKGSLAIQLENYPIGFVFILNIPAVKPEIIPTRKNYFYENNYSFLQANIPFHPPEV